MGGGLGYVARLRFNARAEEGRKSGAGTERKDVRERRGKSEKLLWTLEDWIT